MASNFRLQRMALRKTFLATITTLKQIVQFFGIIAFQVMFEIFQPEKQ